MHYHSVLWHRSVVACIIVTCIQGLIPVLMQTWECVHMLTCHENAVSGLHVMGKLLITASFDRFIRCFDLELHVYDMHNIMYTHPVGLV